MPIDLAFHSFGSGPPLVILHGLFGCKENWRYVARQLSHQFQVITLDQRNHGQSQHTDDFNYQLMADDLLAFLNSQKLDQVHLLGHSMGGKTAMQFAACYPQRLNKLIIEDISPVAYLPRHLELFTALNRLPITKLDSRVEADRLLKDAVPDLAVRQFLLKNLQRRPDSGFAWRFNLPILEKHYPQLISTLDITHPIKVPTLFLRGSRSDYLPPDLPPEITSIFKEVELQTIEDAGHWVHAEQPQAFLQVVKNFLLDTRGA